MATKTSTSQGKAGENNVDPRLMKALSHPLRQRILQLLNQRVLSPVELAGELEESLGVVSYHVKILEGLDAVELVDTKPVRGALQHFYRPTVRSYLTDQHWAQLPLSIRRALFDQTLQQIWDHLVDTAREEGLDDLQNHISWTDFEFDEQAYQEMAAELVALLEKAMDLNAESAARLSSIHEDEREIHRTELAILHFHRASATRVSKQKKRRSQQSKRKPSKAE